MYQVNIKEIAPIRVAFMRHIGPYMEADVTWHKMISWALSNKIDLKKATRLGVAYDDPNITPKDKLRYDACIGIDEKIKVAGEVGEQVIAGGKYATVIYKGPYENIADVYNWFIGIWLPQSGYEAAENYCFEIYLNSPHDTKPKDLLTEICLRIK